MEDLPSVSSLFPYGVPSENEDKRYPNTEDTQRIANYANQSVDQYLEAKPNLPELPADTHLSLPANSTVAGAAVDTLNFVARNDPVMRESELLRSEQRAAIKEKYGLTDIEAEGLYLQLEKNAKRAMATYPNMNFEEAVRSVGQNLTEDMINWIKASKESDRIFSNKITTIRQNSEARQKQVEKDRNQIVFLK